ncbi:MAG: hypothetical protein V4444_03630 [Pseudomonadota bacterium]
MKKEIASIRTRLPEVRLFGFGSFFRDAPYEDIDVLAVFPDDGKGAMRSYQMLRHFVREISTRNNVTIDLTVLTNAEFEGQPLRDKESLIPIQ